MLAMIFSVPAQWRQVSALAHHNPPLYTCAATFDRDSPGCVLLVYPLLVLSARCDDQVAVDHEIDRLAVVARIGETVRYYKRRGLVAEPARPRSGVRRYSAEDVEQLRFIRRAQAVGFTLAEIEALLALRARRACHETRELAAARLSVVDTRLRELRRLQKELRRWIAECDANRERSNRPVMERLALTERGR